MTKGYLTSSTPTPIRPDLYEAIATLLRDPAYLAKRRKQILKDDPEFAKWFKSQPSK